MKQISIDIETYSSTNLNQTGVYRYADSDDFELLLFGYATDFGPVKVVDLTQGEKIPPQIIPTLLRVLLMLNLNGSVCHALLVTA